jgi:hypothetical protein
LEMREDQMPYWSIQAYTIANHVFTRTENERAESGDDSDSSNSMALTGPGDSGAFGAIWQYMEENKLKAKEPPLIGYGNDE